MSLKHTKPGNMVTTNYPHSLKCFICTVTDMSVVKCSKV